MYSKHMKTFSSVKEISVSELNLLKKQQSDFVIVDTRTKREFLVSKIPGAIFKSQFEKAIESYKNKKIIVYCTIGYRSGLYATQLSKRGYDVYNLRGSMLGWVHHQQPIVDQQLKPTKKMHVYGRKWDLLPDGYEPIW